MCFLSKPSLDAAPEKFRKLRWIAIDGESRESAANWRSTGIGAESLAIIQYTSGSTTHPRGVMLSHNNLLHNLGQIRQRFGLSTRSSGVIWLPPYHDMGLIGGILQPVYSGFACTLMSPPAFLQRPIRWLQAISKYGGTISGGPDFAFDLCVRKISPGDRAQLDLRTWELAFNGAEPVRWKTMEQFAGAFAECGFRREAFRPCYGLAEATLMVTSGRVLEPAIADASVEQGIVLTGCGPAIDHTDIRIVDPESLLEAPEGSPGEVWVSGPSVAKGYFNRPQDSEQTFGAELNGVRYLRTGDLAYRRNGELFITGRLKDLIIIRGANYHPHDIEAAVQASHSAARRNSVVAFGIAGADCERLVLVVEVERHDEVSADAVAAAARSAVAEMNGLEIDRVVLVKTGGIPKTSSGKIRRSACRDAFLQGGLQPVSEWKQEERKPTARRTGSVIRNWLTNALAERLGVPPAEIDIRRPFTDHGLESADAVALALDLETGRDKQRRQR